MDEKRKTDSTRERRYQRKKKENGRFYVLCLIAIAAVAVVVCSVVSLFCKEPTEMSQPVTEGAVHKMVTEIPPASQQNDLLKIAVDAVGEGEQKLCYLTFDDGPTEAVTPQILDVLERYDVPATFFMLGRMVEARPDLARQVHQKGHLLANHGYSHDYKAMYETAESFWGEIEKTEGLIREATGEEPFRLMRFPGGGQNAGSYGEVKQTYKTVLQEKGYYFADWNALNGDAEGHGLSASQLLERVKETAKGQKIVVLMHDAAAKKTTPEALPAIIEYLQSQGYEFRRMDEIRYYDKGEPEEVSSMIL